MRHIDQMEDLVKSHQGVLDSLHGILHTPLSYDLKILIRRDSQSQESKVMTNCKVIEDPNYRVVSSIADKVAILLNLAGACGCYMAFDVHV